MAWETRASVSGVMTNKLRPELTCPLCVGQHTISYFSPMKWTVYYPHFTDGVLSVINGSVIVPQVQQKAGAGSKLRRSGPRLLP